MTEPTVKAETLYTEATQSYRYIVEWRYKILTRFFITVTAFVLAAAWLWRSTETDLKPFLFIPLFIGALSSIGFLAMDRRNKAMIDKSQDVARKLEEDRGVYSAWAALPKWPPAYDVIVAIIYVASAVLLFAASVACLAIYTF